MSDESQDSSAPVSLSPRHFGSGAKMSGHFGISLMVPKCHESELSWVRGVLVPRCLYTIGAILLSLFHHKSTVADVWQNWPNSPKLSIITLTA